MKEFPKLKKECSKYPELDSRKNDKPKIHKRSKGKSKNEPINRFYK